MLVLGSGFVALQAAWAARQRGAAVTVVELEGQILPRVLDAAAARILLEQLQAHGVEVRTGTRTEGFEACLDGTVRVSAAGHDPIAVDAVIVATGARPNDGLVPECVETGAPGIPVTATMATAVDGVYAAGDVTRGPTAAGGPRRSTRSGPPPWSRGAWPAPIWPAPAWSTAAASA